jgi:prepilin-type N-terminal cleavage/methylation domain-containing protein
MKRRGFSIIEMIIAGTILAVLMTISLQMMAVSTRQRQAAQDRLAANQEAANAMERLAALPWERLTPEGVAGVKLPEDAPPEGDRPAAGAASQSPRALPGATLDVAIADAPPEADALPARRVTVAIEWLDRGGSRARTELVAWRYKR